MIFRPFLRFDTGCAAYVLGCGGLGRCAVVDPRADDVDAYIAFAAEKKMAITHVIDTHVHADHESGGPALAARTGARYCLHESAEVRHPFSPLCDGDEIELGNTRLRVMHTPGHTPESVCLVGVDLRRGPEPWFVLTGDTLFSGAVGRPDLPGDAAANAARLHESLGRLLALPDDLEVWPAHFGGSACGAGISGKPCSTIGFERRWSPALGLDREAFVAAAVEVPAKPAEMERLMRANRGEP
jgi:hydroxyacylglutathione hydrolase